MRAISRELQLPIASERAFALLHSPSAIRDWWSASAVVVAARLDGVWAASWGPEDSPDYVTAARIVVWDPPHRLRLGRFEYFTRDGGLPFDAALETEFIVRPAPDGSVLVVIQEGFPDAPAADEFFAACQRGWTATFDGIRRHVETTVRREPAAADRVE